MKHFTLRSQALTTFGFIGMILGAIDPMEGSVLILPGSGLVLLGSYLAGNQRSMTTYRLWIFVLIMIGVATLWGVSVFGGIGGDTGLSMWWGLLILPYPVAWSAGIWAPDSPRWVLWLGILVSAWYMMMFILIMTASFAQQKEEVNVFGMFIGILGLATAIGCIYRLRKITRADHIQTRHQ